jgi:hypothetical protein
VTRRCNPPPRGTGGRGRGSPAAARPRPRVARRSGQSPPGALGSGCRPPPLEVAAGGNRPGSHGAVFRRRGGLRLGTGACARSPGAGWRSGHPLLARRRPRAPSECRANHRAADPAVDHIGVRREHAGTQSDSAPRRVAPPPDLRDAEEGGRPGSDFRRSKEAIPFAQSTSRRLRRSLRSRRRALRPPARPVRRAQSGS